MPAPSFLTAHPYRPTVGAATLRGRHRGWNHTDWRRLPVEVRTAGAKGRGVFATAPLRRLTTIAEFRGRPKWIWDIPEDLWPYAIQVDYDRYVVPRRNSIGWFLNHSCEPNCVVSGLAIITERDIGNGEELAFDYSTDVDWPGFKMECQCGSPMCRRVVRAYRRLPKAAKLRYGRSVAPYILRRYKVRRP